MGRRREEQKVTNISNSKYDRRPCASSEQAVSGEMKAAEMLFVQQLHYCWVQLVIALQNTNMG